MAQYVAQQLTPAPRENRDAPENRANLRAYAYNAIGLDESRGANPKTLHSFYIEGDPVVGLGTHVGRTQSGRVVRYTPPPTTSILQKRWEMMSFKWHRLSGVEEGICHCMNGRGKLSITPWSSTREY